MAEPTSISQILPSPILEGALTAFTKKLEPLIGQQIQTGTYAPTIATQAPFTQAAQQQAAAQAGLGALQFDPNTGAVTSVGAGTGIGGYEPFLQAAQAATGSTAYQQYMSPYQQDVINTTLSEFDRQRQMGLAGQSAQAVGAGAFGGAREGVQRSEYGAQSLQDRAALEAQLRQQGFGQAQQLAQQQFTNQMQLAQQQPALAQQQISNLGALGQSDLAYRQALLDAQASAAREAQYEPFTRLGLVGQQLAQIQPGAFPTQTVGYQQPQAPASPLQTLLGVGAGIGGLAGAFKGIF
jgi:hypothetical protein